VIWFRAATLAIVIGVVVVALTSAQSPPPAIAEPTPVPTPVATTAPTRVPLPTLAPQNVVSVISRATPAPPPRATPSSQPFVEIVDYGYSPAQMTIQVGTSVEFGNQGEDGHDVTGTGPGGDWRSGPLAPSEHYSRVFALPGTYDYVCTIHPEMRGRIVVQS
jgi:plastocyanin